MVQNGVEVFICRLRQMKQFAVVICNNKGAVARLESHRVENTADADFEAVCLGSLRLAGSSVIIALDQSGSPKPPANSPPIDLLSPLGHGTAELNVRRAR